MYILKENKLEIGDIILTCSDEKVSRIIKKYTKGSYSHAILYVGSGSYIHSDLNGVHAGNVQRLLFDKYEHAIVLRYHGRYGHVINGVCSFARTQIGKKYSIKSAINAKIKTRLPLGKNKQFCSKLVAQAYKSVDIDIVNNSECCTPQEIEMSPLLAQVSDCIQTATEAEKKYALSESPIDRQNSATNEILRESRKIIGKDIQTLDALSDYVLKNPQFDFEISQCIKDSGYLNVWDDEETKNYWRYNFFIFMGMPMSIEERKQRAAKEIEKSTAALERFRQILQGYRDLHKRNPLEYTKIHVELYSGLCVLIQKQHNTANSVLNALK